MSAAQKDRNTPVLGSGYIKLAYPVAGSATIYKGTIVALRSGAAEPALTATTTQVIVGMALNSYVNSATTTTSTPVLEVQVQGARWTNGATSTLTIADVGNLAYAVDDQTVQDSSNAAAVGIILNVDSEGVWVLTGGGMLG